MVEAAAVTSFIAPSVAANFGLTSRPTRAAEGTSSCSSPSCFDPSSAIKKFTPVALPPGRLWLATRPYGTGSSVTPKTMGIVKVAALAANATFWPPVVAIKLIFGPAVFDPHILAFDIAGVFKALAKRAQTVRHPVRRSGLEIPDHRHRRLLRPRRERPRRRRAAEQRDELAPCRVDHGLPPGTRCASIPQAMLAPKGTGRHWAKPELF